MKKSTLSFLILISGILISGAIIGSANAQTDSRTVSEISYPVVELGNCADKASCKAYCDKTENMDSCLSFAEKNNLMQKGEIDTARKFKDTGMTGPGSCKGQVACEQYCGNSVHLEECTAFAEKNGLMSDQQLQDSKKVIAAIKGGLKPPACGGPQQCSTYCSNPAHMEECMSFSIAAGIVPDNQKAQMQKTLEALKQGAKPPACQPNPPSDQLGQSGQTNQSDNGLPSCDEYCGTHQEECMSFSLATGMVPDDQKEQMQKTLTAFKQGIKPPACQPNPPSESGQSNQPGQPSQPNKNQPNQTSQPKQFSGQGLQACDQYCADPSHVEECVKFSVAIGNMTEKQAQNSIKNGNKGPGGCVGRDECDTFCGNPDNQETCFNFAKDNGMISEEDLQNMQDGQPGQGGLMKPGQNKNNQGQNQQGQQRQNQQNTQQNQQGQNQNQNQNDQGQQNQQGQNQPGQPGENQPTNQMQPGQLFREKIESNQPDQMQPQQTQKQFNQPNSLNQLNQINQPGGQPGQFIQGQPGESGKFIQGQPDQPGQMQPQQQQFQPQPMEQQNQPPPPPPSSFLPGTQKFLANVLNAFR